MVYNNVLYKPASLGERLQAKFGDRGANAVNGSNSANTENGGGVRVLSFFGRIDDTKTADRAIPTRGRATSVRARVQIPAANTRRPVTNTQRASVNIQRTSANAKNAQRNRTRTRTVAAAPEIATTFAKAYAAGERIRTASVNYNGPRRRYAEGAVPSGALRRGRSNIPGSRHAILVTDDSGKENGNVISAIKDAFSDRRVAEHRVKKTPFPLGFVTLIGICAIMVMALIFTFSQVHEYNSSISSSKDTLRELEAEAAKLEVQLAECEDIRDIERIAVEEIGMVSSDVVQSKFVSVAAADRVEVLREDKTEEDGGFSSLLSSIGESFGKIGEYFN